MTAYSQAPRCRQCGEKALLAQAGAQALADASNRALAAFECPHNPGWHVGRPQPDQPA